MASNRKSRDQKRKAKLAKKAKSSLRQDPLVYHGSKYRRPDLAITWVETESAIYQCFVMMDRELVDEVVSVSLKSLIHDLKRGPLSEFLDPLGGELSKTDDSDANFVSYNIQRHWKNYFKQVERPSRDDLIGILRSILGLIEEKKNKAGHPCAYILYAEDFLTNQVGVNFERVDPEMLEGLPEIDFDSTESDF